MDDEQVGVFRADDVGRRVAILDDRHFTDAGPGLHRGDNGPARRADVHVQAAGEHDENVLVFRARR